MYALPTGTTLIHKPETSAFKPVARKTEESTVTQPTQQQTDFERHRDAFYKTDKETGKFIKFYIVFISLLLAVVGLIAAIMAILFCTDSMLNWMNPHWIVKTDPWFFARGLARSILIIVVAGGSILPFPMTRAGIRWWIAEYADDETVVMISAVTSACVVFAMISYACVFLI